jgi:hypothetical protein
MTMSRSPLKSVALMRLATLVLFLLLAPAAAFAIINPNFTPVHLTEGAEQIALVRAEVRPDAKTVPLTILETVKGDALKQATLDLTETAPEQVPAALDMLVRAGKEPCLLFLSRKDGKGYMHVNGRWLRLGPGEGDRWTCAGVEDEMLATWNGGTDMLLRCVRFVLAAPGKADVPFTAGVSWRAMAKIGAAPADATLTALAALDLKGDGTPYLYIAGDKGVVLLRVAKGNEVKDVSAEAKLGPALRGASAWGDFNGDGRLDLASADGKTLTIWTQGADGAFTPAEVKPAADIIGLTTLPAAGRTALLVTHTTGLSIVELGDKLAVGELPALAGQADLGEPMAAIVADFTNDGLPDIVWPLEKGGVLYEGVAGEASRFFGAPRACAVSTEIGGARSALCDFDGDGLLDILLCGNAGVRIFQNLGKGEFVEAMPLSGEVSYKSRRFASWGDAADFTSDGRDDLLITYYDEMPQLYFNRGFRSLGFAVEQVSALSGNDDLNAKGGLQGGIFADLDGDGAQDMVLVKTDGEVWCLYNDVGKARRLFVRVKMPARAVGPVAVDCKTKTRALSRAVLRAGNLDYCFHVPEPGPCTLTWQFPGGKPQTKTVPVIDMPVTVTLTEGK